MANPTQQTINQVADRLESALRELHENSLNAIDQDDLDRFNSYFIHEISSANYILHGETK
ncbi:MAG: hypothetical protein RRB22_13185 [Gammaproteobacteria bacterium]|nr:hypothetical protein [Gammaproteobacteria bacterium]